MPKAQPYRGVDGKIISYKARLCLGRDTHGKQIWVTTTIPRPDKATDAAATKEAQRIIDVWTFEQKEAYKTTQQPTRDKSRIPLDVFVSDHWWKDSIESGSITPNGKAYYTNNTKHIIAFFVKKHIGDIRKSDILHFINYLKSEVTTTGTPYSPRTIHHIYSTLNSVLRFAAQYEYIPKNPCDTLPTKDKPQKGKHALTEGKDFLNPQQAAQLIAALNEQPTNWKVYFNLLLLTGMRRSEALALTWQDVNLEDHTIIVSKSVTRNPESDTKASVKTTKSGTTRTIFITDRTADLLRELRADQTEKFGILLPNAFLFSNSNDPYRAMFPTTPTRKLQKICEANGLPAISPHDLRHTAASLALLAGSNMREVQELLGHADPETTMAFYTGITKEAKQTTVARIEEAIYKNA